MNWKSLFLLVLATFLAREAVADDVCTPDYAGWGMIDSTTSMDGVAKAFLCNSADPDALLAYYWDRLHLGESGDYWPAQAILEGFGCGGGSNGALTRLIDAAAGIDMVWNALHSTTLGQAPWAYQFMDFLYNYGHEGFEAEACTNDDVVAANPYFGATKLHYKFFFTYDVFTRAGTLIHEVSHEFVSHADPECGASCIGNGGKGSCDEAYGLKNAQTWDIRFLDQAVQSYRRDGGSPDLKVRNYGNDVCGWIPLLSEQARLSSASLVKWKLDQCFNNMFLMDTLPMSVGVFPSSNAGSSYGGWQYTVDQYYQARWVCGKVCDPAEHVWPDGVDSCNSDWQPGNYDINNKNRAMCEAANAKVDAGVTPAQLDMLRKSLNYYQCLAGISDSYVAGYCEDLEAKVADVPALEAAWNLPDVPGSFDSGEALGGCVRTYCQSNFDPAWVSAARQACYEWDGDSLGCLASVCPSMSETKAQYGADSREYFRAIQCVRHFVENAGDPAGYKAPDDICGKEYFDCREVEAFNAWMDGKAVGKCGLMTADATAPAAPVSIGRWELGVLADLKSAPSYATFHTQHYASVIDSCMIGEATCEAMRDILHGLAAKMVTVSKIPLGILQDHSLPDPAPDQAYRGVDANVRALASIVAGRVQDPTLDAVQAVRRLGRNAEANWSMSRGIGAQAWFALMGDKGAADVFGKTMAQTLAGSEFPVTTAASPEQQQQMAGLQAGRTVRLRVESFETVALFQTAASSALQSDLFTYVQAVVGASTVEGIDAALDALAGSL